MRLDQEGESTNVEDRRGMRVSRGLAGGGIGTIAIVLIGLFFGIDPSVLLQGNIDSAPARPGNSAGRHQR